MICTNPECPRNREPLAPHAYNPLVVTINGVSVISRGFCNECTEKLMKELNEHPMLQHLPEVDTLADDQFKERERLRGELAKHDEEDAKRREALQG